MDNMGDQYAHKYLLESFQKIQGDLILTFVNESLIISFPIEEAE